MPRLDTCIDPAGPAVHVWALRLGASATQLDQLQRGLLDDERERARSYRIDSARHEFIVTRAALRTLLAGYLNLSPTALRFSPGARGKPALVGHRGLGFNVAHSSGLALIGFAAGAEVGVDIEALAPLPDVEALVERVFDRADAARWQALPDADRLPAFYRGWTRKEACAKASGDGLWADLPALRVSLAAGRAAAITALDDAGGWALHDIGVGATHFAALACASGQAVAPLRWTDVSALLAP